jgi:hypothetical protein
LIFYDMLMGKKYTIIVIFTLFGQNVDIIIF